MGCVFERDLNRSPVDLVTRTYTFSPRHCDAQYVLQELQASIVRHWIGSELGDIGEIEHPEVTICAQWARTVCHEVPELLEPILPTERHSWHHEPGASPLAFDFGLPSQAEHALVPEIER